MLFILLIYRGFKAALRSPDGFGQLLAAGLSAILAPRRSSSWEASPV